ncbi:hypothetical protein O0I10_006379 [Lichtheimia ornata]|uniref:Uncharacterized protein n=1 Tax=Lichtheimia ornata TaxID=688661 RepID=A0AAD7V582_9FUNG|nr:uncharacterized protein O0I10_006379 [Lichtheimia ornata]KAJ8657851.1 hypothetical protein O0I10_006379 [Lichtheimia ornata]
MKSMRCSYRNGRFDDQYTLDLEGFMTRQEFAGVMHAFNAAAQRHPPPPSFTSGRMATLILCTGASILCSVGLAIYYTHHIALLLGIPFSFVALSSILVAWRRRLKVQFESAILHLCACMNATENIRGINYRLCKAPPPSPSPPDYLPQQQQQHSPHGITPPPPPPPHLAVQSIYGIVIEFDDRYNLLHHFAISAQGVGNNGVTMMNSSSSNGGGLPPYRPSLVVVADPPTYRQSQAGLPLPSHAYHPDEKL